MKNLIFLMLAILLINVSFAAEGQMDETKCTASINKTKAEGKAIDADGDGIDDVTGVKIQ